MTDPDYFAVLIANQILGGDFNSYINMNLREAHGWTYGARTSIYDKRVSTSMLRHKFVMRLLIVRLLKFKKNQNRKVTDEMLASVKAGYIGRFVMQIENHKQWQDML
jgi:predicted Zn-dependent peptidase